jgi:transcriptional regulator with XRE-family HTH domain
MLSPSEVPVESSGREVKFDSILRELLDGSTVIRSRRGLAASLFVSEATISHYLGGRVRPSFDVLVRMAQSLNVPLDFLVFGERPTQVAADDPGETRSQIRRALAEAADHANRQRDLTARITRRLNQAIETAAAELLERGEFGLQGFVTDSEAMAMEIRTSRMRIMTRIFQSDIQVTGGSASTGTFFEVVADNLRRGRRYEYLLYGPQDRWITPVEEFRRLLSETGVPEQSMSTGLRFRCIDSELTSAVCIHDLELAALEREEPILYERFRDNILIDANSGVGRWAYISVERVDAQGGVVIEPLYAESALRMFERDWKAARAM